MKTNHTAFIVAGKYISTGKDAIQGIFYSLSAAAYAIRHASAFYPSEVIDLSSLRIITVPLLTKPEAIAMYKEWSLQAD